MVVMACSDCGFSIVNITPRTLAKGSTVREPGEAVCASCSASRNKMVRELNLIPNTIDQIKALRMRRSA